MGVRGLGRSKAEAFAQAALALTGVITDPARVRPITLVTIECDAPDDELLLVDWLNALIFEMATRKLLFGRFEVDIVEQRLRGRAWGEAVTNRQHRPAVEVKGATYTSLRVEQRDGIWLAQCVVDV
jgi:tRNA nucleotidyltransferase (CCA-adding enzyme)